MISSLYVHIPFCKKKCDYCDFFSIGEKDRKGKSNDLSDSYIDALLKETDFYAKLYSVSCWKTIYVGGGTPSILSAPQILRLVSGIKKIARTDESTEITFEMNPNDVTENFLKACSLAGINRLSMGLQALDDKALSAVNRGSSVNIIMEALENLKNHWSGRLSVDFIAGLPKQSYSSFKNQFEILKKYPKIDHVSLYTLTIEENTPLAKKIDEGIVKFSEEKADKMWMKGRSILEKMGFYQYEVSNFAKKGFESRHNTVYWKQENYIGVGAGASGTIYDFKKKIGRRWTNTLSIPCYTKEFSRQTEDLDEKTLEFEFLMLGFRRLEGVSSLEYKKRFGSSLAQRLGADSVDGIFSQWKKNRLANEKLVEGDRIFSLNRRGILLLNRFLEEFLV